MRTIKRYELYKGKEYITRGTINQIAEHMGTKRNTVHYYLNKKRVLNEHSKRLVEIEPIVIMPTEYALYYGDEFKMIGTLKEISRYADIKESALRSYSYDSHKERMKRDSTCLVKL